MDLGQERKEVLYSSEWLKNVSISRELLFVKGGNVVFKELDLFC